ncbi:MAG: universal stress protein [Terracidiphilus sp.]
MFPFKKILFPVDFSRAATAMAPSVIAMAQRFNSSVTVLNAFNLVHEYNLSPPFADPTEPGPNAIPYGSVLQDLRDRRGRHLKAFVRAHLSGVESAAMVEDGDPALVIDWAARHEQADLVMMPTRGLGRFRRMLLGSVTAKVLHDVDCPVFTSAHEPGSASQSPTGYRSIVCPVRLDTESEAALKMAGAFALAYDARVCLLHIKARGDTPGAEGSREFLQEAFEHAVEPDDRAGISTRVRILDAQIPEGIRQIAIEQAADLIVLGRGRARGTISQIWSHLYTVIRESPCPVLSV